MIFSKVTGEDFYRAAYKKFKSESDSVKNALLEYSKGKLFTTSHAFKSYNNQRTNALKRRPSRARAMKIEPLWCLIKINSISRGKGVGEEIEGLYEDYDDFDIDLPEFFPVLNRVVLFGENIGAGTSSSPMWWTMCWELDKHNGGLVEIVDPSVIDLTAEAAEATRLRLAAERKEILRVQRLKS
jgi:hypothetical protein